MFDITIVGCGPSAFGFLKGLEKNKSWRDKRILLICPKKYTETTKMSKIYKDISPKFLQKDNLLSLSYYLDTFGKFKSNGFVNIGVHGIGGMSRIWGGAVGIFNEDTLNKNSIEHHEFKDFYNEIKSFLPLNTPIKVSERVKSIYGNYNFVSIREPELLIRNNCDYCNQCLIGCEKNSVWYPLKEDFHNINLNLTILYDTYVSKIVKNYLILDSKEKIKSKIIILGGGVLQNYKLLSQLDELINKKAKILTTPAIAFAFSLFKFNKDKKFFGMGNATFQIRKDNEIILHGNLYDGYSLSISKGKVFSDYILKDNIFKFFAKFMIAGAGFMSSDCADIEVAFKNNEYVFNSNFNENYLRNEKYIKYNLQNFVKSIRSRLIYYKKVKIGADIHYGGGIPYELYDKILIQEGKLKGINNILVIGGSTFSYLSPISPTLSFIVNSYRIGKKL